MMIASIGEFSKEGNFSSSSNISGLTGEQISLGDLTVN
jgi:hypothetical protein